MCKRIEVDVGYLERALVRKERSVETENSEHEGEADPLCQIVRTTRQCPDSNRQTISPCYQKHTTTGDYQGLIGQRKKHSANVEVEAEVHQYREHIVSYLKHEMRQTVT
jgi:hypothetical protein